MQSLLNVAAEPDTLEPETVSIPRTELEMEHRWLLARLHRLRQQLGYPPLPTGKEQRRQERRTA
jgi:hypothetical protein